MGEGFQDERESMAWSLFMAAGLGANRPAADAARMADAALKEWRTREKHGRADRELSRAMGRERE